MKKLFQIFQAGTHSPMSGNSLQFSESDLATTASAYSFQSKPAPLVIGHPEDNFPTYGNVLKLIAKGKELFALADVKQSLLDLVRQGAYKKVSASFYQPNSRLNPVPGVFSLRHVGFLGSMPPAVKGMAALEFAEWSDCPACLSEPSSSTGNPMLDSIKEFQQIAPGLSYSEIISLANYPVFP